VSWILRIALDEPPPAPEPIHGIEIRRFQPSDARDAHRVVDTAFSEWPGRDPEPFEVWASDDLAHPKFAPEISPLAFDGDELVGLILAFDYPELSEGWIMQLATKASHRRRGIAQALLRTSFGWFFDRGRRIAGVSTDSRTGALGLYEKVGMRVVRQYTRYAKRLD
jgi:ribosomal protein S18 acetylase RimI-like enzyme